MGRATGTSLSASAAITRETRAPPHGPTAAACPAACGAEHTDARAIAPGMWGSTDRRQTAARRWDRKSCDVLGHPSLQANGIDRMRRGLAQIRFMHWMRLRPRRCTGPSHDAMPPMPGKPPHLEDRYPPQDAPAEFARSPTLQSFRGDRSPASRESGQIALTRMPYCPHSTASARIRFNAAAFEA